MLRENPIETKAEMPCSALVELLEVFQSAAIPIWLDGGWGVDALLERQSREHGDVDIVLCRSDVPRLQTVLDRRGFTVLSGKPPDSFVLANGSGLEVDVHAVVFDDNGNGIYRMQNGEDWIYPAEGFNGRGVIVGMKVRCLSPAIQVLGHAYGYTPMEKDLRDMELLQKRFGVELPPQLRPNKAGPCSLVRLL